MSTRVNIKSNPPESVVVVVGSLNTDFVLTLDTFPASGESVLGKTFEQAPGGKGLNQAVAASRLGAQVAMIGAVGSDQFGHGLIQTLTEEGIKSLVSQVPDISTGMAIIEVESHFDLFAVSSAGAQGMMQVMPFWKDDIGSSGDNLTLTKTNLEYGRRILQFYLQRENPAMHQTTPPST